MDPPVGPGPPGPGPFLWHARLLIASKGWTTDVDGWRSRSVKELADAATALLALEKEVGGPLTESQMNGLWRCYLSVEKSVAFVKLELDEDQELGRFVNKKAYVVPDERQALLFAAESLNSGLGYLRTGELEEALKRLRESRNYLRMLLRRAKLSRRGGKGPETG